MCYLILFDAIIYENILQNLKPTIQGLTFALASFLRLLCVIQIGRTRIAARSRLVVRLAALKNTHLTNY